MQSNININMNKKIQYKRKFYISVPVKFLVSHIFSLIWIVFSIYISINWIKDFSKIVSLPAAIIIITGIAYIPGYLNAFLIISLIMDRQPSFKNLYPLDDITILIAARNEADKIDNTLSYIAKQDYTGKCKILVIDNGSTDLTTSNAIKAAEKLNLDLSVISEENPGKYNALNTGLKYATTDLIITLDADTLLHKSAVRYLIGRIKSAPSEVCAVAGSILVHNSRDNLITKIQEWDYFLGIASIKRLQGLYQGTLVAQGAYSIYKTKNIKEIGGWPNAIGEDIVLTWTLLSKGWRTYFEPLAVAFTDVPTTLYSFSRQRSRWARGMIEALKAIKPWKQPYIYIKYLTSINFIMPYLDFAYTFCWLPGLILALFGIYWIVGPMTLLVLPLTLISYTILFIYQRYVFRSLNLKVRKNLFGFILFTLFYQMIMSPVSVWGYLQEFFKLKRKWK
ncbi:glycosyltransferase family 2 protein [Clostridium sp. DJ247]|uniref:glycosyltransferase n=1 Tax=Clostridium sp. DJ247 TaxID=2726188 RepID=UPI00162ADB9D|nr:glycosyltransferase [Clostridium sp. DJ247]MBC2581682.1 glycosyltransferase family 2 protein [Clostridium sp. DJ247]